MTLPLQEGSWTCFHCNEIFTDVASAAEHFGETELQRPACAILSSESQGLLKALRESEREVGSLRHANEQLDYEAGAYHAQVSELQRRFGDDVRSVSAAWLKFEAMESRAMAAEERLRVLARDIVTGHGAQFENLDISDNEYAGVALAMFGPEYEEHFEVTMRFSDWLALVALAREA